MRKSKYNEEDVANALDEANSGAPVEDICARLNISVATFYNWRKRYSGLAQSELKIVKDLEDENKRLKQQVQDLLKDKEILQDIISKKGGKFK